VAERVSKLPEKWRAESARYYATHVMVIMGDAQSLSTAVAAESKALRKCAAELEAALAAESSCDAEQLIAAIVDAACAAPPCAMLRGLIEEGVRRGIENARKGASEPTAVPPEKELCLHEDCDENGICKACGAKARITLEGLPADFFAKRKAMGMRDIQDEVAEEAVIPPPERATPTQIIDVGKCETLIQDMIRTEEIAHRRVAAGFLKREIERACEFIAAAQPERATRTAEENIEGALRMIQALGCSCDPMHGFTCSIHLPIENIRVNVRALRPGETR